MLKLFVILFVFFYSIPADAGFGTGFVAGAVVGGAVGSSTSSSASGNSFYSSDKEGRDVVVCCTEKRSNYLMCEDYGVGRIAPEQFIKRAGYTRMYHKGFLKTSSGCDMIVMEVGK